MSTRIAEGAFANTITYGFRTDSAHRETQRLAHAPARPETRIAAKTGAGVWIDHRKAVIVFVALGGMSTTLILSLAEKQPSRIGGHRSSARFEHNSAPALDSRMRRFTGRLDHYYDTVIDSLRDAQSTLVLGPGAAKDELRRRLALSKHDHRAFAFETADKMTSRQIEAKTMEWLESARLAKPSSGRRAGRPAR